MAIAKVGVTTPVEQRVAAASVLGVWAGDMPRNAGDLLIARVGAVSGAAIQAPAGWIGVGAGDVVQAVSRTRIFYMVATGGDPAPTFTSAGAGGMGCSLEEFTAGYLQLGTDGGAGNGSGAPLLVTAGAAPSLAGGLSITSAVDRGTSGADSETPGAGWVAGGWNTNAVVSHFGGDYHLNPSTGAPDSETITITMAVVTSFVAQIATFLSGVAPIVTNTPTNALGGRLSSLGNIVLGGIQKALRFGVGATSPPRIPYFSYRIYDPVTGALVIANLPHPHRSKWTIKALQPGNVGSAAIGNFEIPLYTPLDAPGRAAAPIYALLQEGQRVECYESSSPDVDSTGGVPFASGVIRSKPSSLADFAIKGVDSIFLLQDSRTQRTEFFSGRTDQLAAFALTAYQPTFMDDFLSASLAAYTQTGTGVWTAAIDEGLPVATIAGDSTAAASILTTGNFAQNTYVDCVLDNYFRLVFAGNTSVQHGLVAAYAAGVYTVGYLNARFVSTLKWELDLVIATVAAGVLTPRITKTLVVVEPTNVMRGQLALIGKQGTLTGSTFQPSATGPDYLWRLTLNGIDAGCVWISPATTPSGGVGKFYATGARDTGTATADSATSLTDTTKHWQANSFVGAVVTMSGNTATILTNTDQMLTFTAWSGGGTPALSTYAIASLAPTGSPQLWSTQLTFFSRLNVMQPGVTNVGARSVLQYTPRTPMLDLLNYASVTEGNVYRKNPRQGLNQDTVDWGPPVGSEQPGQTAVGADSRVRFVFGKNLAEYTQEENSDPLATDISLQLSPSGDQAGILNWHVIPAIRKYGLLTDTVQAQYLADFLSARALAQVIGQTKSTPGLSKTFKVLRDAETAGLWRELDYVVVHHPEFQPPIINQRMQVLERVTTEGDPYETITADKFPAETFGVELSRMWQTLDAIAIGSAQVTPSSVGAGLVYDSRFGSPQVLPFYGPYLSVDPTLNYRFRFQIPNSVVLIQRITLAFSLLPYRTYSSFTLSATAAETSDHFHNVGGETGHTHSHTHTMSIGAGGAGGTINMVSPNGPLQLSAGGPLTDSTTINANAQASSGHNHGATGGRTAAHTHTVSGSSTLGITEGAVAQGVHVLIDNVDVTFMLSTVGPYGTGQATDFGEYDITQWVLGGGWHEIAFSSTTLGAIVAQGMMYVITKPTV